MSVTPMSGQPMRKIAFLNQKGGVGKTTSAVNLAAALAAGGRGVCLVDLDPQAHASLHLDVVLEPDQPSIYDVLTGDATFDEARREIALSATEDQPSAVQPNTGRLSVVGSHINLAAAEVELVGMVGREMILQDKIDEDLAKSTDRQSWDYLIVDCPPSLGLLTLNALVAVDEVYIPMQPHFLALHGLGKLLETIQLVRKRLNPRLRLGGVILSMYDANTRLAAEVTDDVRRFFDQGDGDANAWASAGVCETKIRRNIRLAEAPSFGQSIFSYAPDSHGAEDYASLAMEIDSAALPSVATPAKQAA